MMRSNDWVVLRTHFSHQDFETFVEEHAGKRATGVQ